MQQNNEHKKYMDEYWKKISNHKKLNILNGTKKPRHLSIHTQIKFVLQQESRLKQLGAKFEHFWVAKWH